MNSPILVWMLYLNREVTTEVSNNFLPHRHNSFATPRPHLFLPPPPPPPPPSLLKELKKVI